MPPKSVTCSICKSEVLKAQTFAVADGSRACRTHEGVAEAAAARQTAAQAKAEAAFAKGTATDQWRRRAHEEQAVFSANWEQEAAAWREKIYSHCWTCDCEGLEGGDFFAQALIAMKRLEIRGEFNFLSMGPDVRKLMGGVSLIMEIKLENDVVDRAVIKHVKDKKLRDIVSFMGFVLICPQCCDKHGFKKRFEAMMPKPTWDQITAMLPVVAGMDPLLRAMAEKKEGQS